MFCCRPHPATSSSTGGARRTSAAEATARCTLRTLSERSCCAVWARRSPISSSGRSATWPLSCWDTSGLSETVAGDPRIARAPDSRSARARGLRALGGALLAAFLLIPATGAAAGAGARSADASTRAESIALSPPSDALAVTPVAPASTGGAPSRALLEPGSQTSQAQALVYVAPSEEPPAGRRLSSNRVLAIAAALGKMRALRREHPGAYPAAYLKVPFRWQVSYFSRDGKKELGQVIIDDLSGRVLEAWTGFQVAWGMARGYPGAFGRHVNSLYVCRPLGVLFVLPFLNFRRPLSLLHLDLLVLLSFSVSLAFFSHARISASVPLVYPPLLYLLARMLALSRGRRARRAPPVRMLVPARWLAVAVLFLVGFRIALNVTDSNVIDVGYAGVIGAHRIVSGKPLYGHYPSDNERGDTYGAANYEAYVPFERLFGWSGTWDDLPAAHAAAIAFDLLALSLLFLLGRRVRGPSMGIALAYAWASYPFTLFALESNSNDTLVAALVLAIALAVIPRRLDAVGLAAAAAAIVIATQLGIDHWFYLYIPWFFPLVMLALLGALSWPARSLGAASGSARSTRPAAAVSSG